MACYNTSKTKIKINISKTEDMYPPPLFPPRTAELLTFFRCLSQWEQYAHGMPLGALVAQKFRRGGSEAVYKGKAKAEIKPELLDKQ